MRTLLACSLFLSAIASAEEISALPKELEIFLGAKPKQYEQLYLKPAKKFREALKHKNEGKLDLAIQELKALSEKSEFSDHASYELALALREKKEYRKSSTELARLSLELPSTPYDDLAKDLILENDCALGLSESAQAKGPERKKKAIGFLRICLAKTSWKAWSNREQEASALYTLLKTTQDPLLGPFIAELLQALPSSSALRAQIAKEIPEKELREYATAPRFRTKSLPASGVKAVQPDLELINQGMLLVLEEKWQEANTLFRKLQTEYPQSEHLERALYWIARSEEKMGNAEEAKLRYEQLLSDSPITYYGLQSALRLKRELRSFLVPSELNPKAMVGTPLTRQATSLWKLRALLEVGLLEHAREEAKFLFQNRPGGYAFGQESAEGALQTALLFNVAGYHLAAFANAYAASSLDPAQLNVYTLGLIFPASYEKEFASAAELTGVHELLLSSLTKQESAFLPNAVSRADAMGLMQLLYSTAREVEPGLEKKQLFEAQVNLRIGSRYLQKLLERYQGNIALALAGYNAGPSRANQWQKRMLEFESMRKNFEVDVFIDSIPFTETRKYVSSILRNYAWYKLLANDGTIVSIQELAFQWQKKPKTTEVTKP
jgi:soluble lytic murein transglycosylase-like protein